MSLDADEYNRRIKIVKTRRQWANDANEKFLDETSQKLLDQLDDKQAPTEYHMALTRCKTYCRVAKEKYTAGNKQSAVQNNGLLIYRAEVIVALKELIEEFTA